MSNPATKLKFERIFSTTPLPESTQVRSAEITDETGKVIFKQEGISAPDSWSDLAVKVVVSKYFYGEQGKPERESSVQQLVHRVCKTIADWGVAGSYFDSATGEIFYDELMWLCLHQHMAFNSPVWFNVGLHHQYGIGVGSGRGNWYYNPMTGVSRRAATQYEYPQCSACFINQVEDTMESIMSLAEKEATLFKFGSGTGTDLSPIRSSREKLSGGGKPSGPMSFLRIYDQVANVVKSGGKTRRAAKMNTLYDWHGDIEEFILAKITEEKKAHALIDAGYEGNFNGAAYGTVAYQNENLSVRATDEFMKAATEGDGTWWTKSVTTGQPLERKDARKLLNMVAEGTWFCGDPGMQFDGAIQKWHTCKGTEPIYSTNPCSEYVFLNNTACNLASLNLMKFQTDAGFDVQRFQAAVRLTIVAQEILVDNSSYPSPDIAQNSHIFRTLGLGYANLGALIMSLGYAYDSDESRNFAAAVSSLMTAEAYLTSAVMAEHLGPFRGYVDEHCAHVPKDATAVAKKSAPSNAESMLGVLQLHAAASAGLPRNALSDAADKSWRQALAVGKLYGYRNAQVTVIAPTGTIAFMMDCDTTGIEPDLGLVKYKSLAGRGMLKLVNQTVPKALKSLGYSPSEVASIVAHVDKHDTIEDVGAEKSGLAPGHLAVFDCSFKPAKGRRSIQPMAHLRIMSAVQPFISGAISKTVNLPSDATVDDVRDAYVEAWKLGLKCVAIYRDGSKRSQPLNTSKLSPEKSKLLEERVRELESENNGLARRIATLGAPARRRLSVTRNAITHKFDIGGHEGYLTVGMYDNGEPGEVFITMAKEGSTVGGLMDTIGTLTSITLQYGVPLSALVEKFKHVRFDPSGYTKEPTVKYASSIIDYIFRWIGARWVTTEHPSPAPEDKASEVQSDSPICYKCGHVTVRSGSCFRCGNCGESQGCS